MGINLPKSFISGNVKLEHSQSVTSRLPEFDYLVVDTINVVVTQNLFIIIK